MKKKKLENCWQEWSCPKPARDKCPVYKLGLGEECWLVSTSYCPKVKRRFLRCTSCRWFKKLSKTKRVN